MSQLFGYDLANIPSLEMYNSLLTALDTWFTNELGIKLRDNVNRIVLQEVSGKHKAKKFEYVTYLGEYGLSVELYIRPKYVTTEVHRANSSGQLRVHQRTTSRIADWTITAKAQTRTWVDFDPTEMAIAHSELFRNIERHRLSGFEFKFRETEIWVSEHWDTNGNLVSGTTKKVKQYRIEKSFEISLKSLLDITVDYPAPEFSWLFWTLVNQVTSIVIDEHVDISLELLALFESRVIVEYYLGMFNGAPIKFTYLRRDLSTWSSTLYLTCPYASGNRLGAWFEDAQLQDVVLFWNHHVKGNRDLCHGCVNEFKCMAKSYEGGGDGLTYHLDQLEPT